MELRKLSGTYPNYQQWEHILRLVDEQVLAIVDEHDLITLNDPQIACTIDTLNSLWLNKGYIRFGNRKLCLYKHDFTWWLMRETR